MNHHDAEAERHLIEAARQDPARFAELYERHFEVVYAFVARRVAHRAEAEDLTADVFHQALANLGRFEWRGAPLAAWLLRIAANTIVDRARQNARERRLPPTPDRAATSSTLDDAEDRALLFRLVDTLPTEQRQVIALRFVEGRSIRAIADTLGRTEGAVKQLQFRALKHLRERMGDTHG